VSRQDSIAILRMQRADEEVWILPPLLDGVAEQRLDLVTREDVGAALVQSVNVDDERELLDERAITALDLTSLAGHGLSRGDTIATAVHVIEIGPNEGLAVTPKGDSPWF
jgi:hypothetical protein